MPIISNKDMAMSLCYSFPNPEILPDFVLQKSPLLDEILSRLYLSTTPQDGFVPYLLGITKTSCHPNDRPLGVSTPIDIAIAAVGHGRKPERLGYDERIGELQKAYRYIYCEDYLNFTRRVLELIEDETIKFAIFLQRTEDEVTCCGLNTDGVQEGVSDLLEACGEIQARVNVALEVIGSRLAEVIFDGLIMDDPDLFQNDGAAHLDNF